MRNYPEELQQQIIHNSAQLQLQKPNSQTLSITKQRKKYGNNIVFFENPFFFSIGPDYWCFLPTFIIFCVVSFFIIRLVLSYSSNIYFVGATLLICGGMCVAYFLIGTSNPGIVTQQDFTDSQEQQNPMNQETISRKKLCKRCNIRVRRSTYHCDDCGVCVRQYDHHCPWTSKCIGGGNLIRFYVFLGMVPVYLVYVFVTFATVMSQMAIQSTTAHIKINPH